MKAEIHPDYHDINVTCSCGNEFQTRSAASKTDLRLDVCSACHPFYTGESRRISDTEGRVERFRKRYGR